MEISNTILQEKMLVAEVLAMGPQVVTFFVKRRLDCVGCKMASFCTLEDVIQNYDLAKEQFLLDLGNAMKI